MTKIDIFSGFLGAGKTTLIKKLISEAYRGEKLVLIENEFGEIGVDGSFMEDAGIEVNEMNSGCICCSLVGDFEKSLRKVLQDFAPDRILIEPSGVGKLSDVIRAVKSVTDENVVLNSYCVVADAKKCKMYMKNFGEFYNDQIENASSVILSHTASISEDKLSLCVELIREHNKDAQIITTDWDEIDGAKILEVMENKNTLKEEMEKLEHEHHEHHHHHEHDEECHCHEHGHHHDEHCDCGEHHHEHGEHCDCGEHHHDHHHEHEHHHEHSEGCSCGCHDHSHGHHHADDVFSSWGKETVRTYTKEEISSILAQLESVSFGVILRAKGVVKGNDGWIHFDYVPGEADVRTGTSSTIGKICVIGSKINEEKLDVLFR
ncbi:MAG: GTP-binding protein [Clostridia bacterium]|nr:GTP-binding protein [Clostridia bacterium]